MKQKNEKAGATRNGTGTAAVYAKASGHVNDCFVELNCAAAYSHKIWVISEFISRS